MMDETVSNASTSIYQSAPSSADPFSPIPFQTPRTTRARSDSDSDTTPRPIPASSSTLQLLLEVDQAARHSPTPALLDRYINADTSWSASTTPTIEADMPTTTRLQERKQASSTTSTPVRQTPTIEERNHSEPHTLRTPARPHSPLVRTNLLRDVSPHSSSYASTLRVAVDETVKLLMLRGRTNEGHGMRELYTQSFKDPGSAELLDALLRQRPSERQVWDFGRYVEDVNRLSSLTPVVVIPAKEGREVTGATSHEKEKIGQRDSAVGGNARNVPRPLSPRVVIETPRGSGSTRRRMSPRVVIETPTVPIQRTVTMPVETRESPDEVIDTAITSLKAANRLRRKERRRKQAATRSKKSAGNTMKLHLSKPTKDMRSSQIEEANVTRASLSPENARQSLVSLKNRSLALTIREARDSIASINAESYQPRRKKKKRSKMFVGASGPVYSLGLGRA